MTSKDDNLDSIVRQNEFLMKIAKGIFKPIMKGYVFSDIILRQNKGYNKIHIEIPSETREVILNNEIPKLYTAIHISFWETTGFLVCMNDMKFRVPYIVMGSNLAKNNYVKKLSSEFGIILHERNISSIKTLEKNIENYLVENNDIFVFPGGGRTYDGIPKEFKPTSFSGAINASKKREVAVINVAFSYKRVREVEYLVNNIGKSSQGINLKTIIEFMRPMEDIFISFSEPYYINKNDDRKEVAKYNFNMALNEIRILPNNIAGASNLNIDKAEKLIGKLYDNENYNKMRLFNGNNEREMAEFAIEDAHKELRNYKVREYYKNLILHYI